MKHKVDCARQERQDESLQRRMHAGGSKAAPEPTPGCVVVGLATAKRQDEQEFVRQDMLIIAKGTLEHGEVAGDVAIGNERLLRWV